jgi:hypothetical protein
MYANGEGVPLDRPRAYLWLSVAAVTSGGVTDRAALDRVAASLSPEVRDAAERRAVVCRETSFVDCGEPPHPR